MRKGMRSDVGDSMCEKGYTINQSINQSIRGVANLH